MPRLVSSLWLSLLDALRAADTIDGWAGGYLFMPRVNTTHSVLWHVLATPSGGAPDDVAFLNAHTILEKLRTTPAVYGTNADVLVDIHEMFSIALRVLFGVDKWRALVLAQRAALHEFLAFHSSPGFSLAGMSSEVMRPWERGFSGSAEAEACIIEWYAKEQPMARFYFYGNGPAIWIVKGASMTVVDDVTKKERPVTPADLENDEGYDPNRPDGSPRLYLADVLQRLYAGEYETAAAVVVDVEAMLDHTNAWYSTYEDPNDGTLIYPFLVGAKVDEFRASFVTAWERRAVPTKATPLTAAAARREADASAAASSAAAAAATDAADAAYYSDALLVEGLLAEWRAAFGGCVCRHRARRRACRAAVGGPAPPPRRRPPRSIRIALSLTHTRSPHRHRPLSPPQRGRAEHGRLSRLAQRAWRRPLTRCGGNETIAAVASRARRLARRPSRASFSRAHLARPTLLSLCCRRRERPRPAPRLALLGLLVGRRAREGTRVERGAPRHANPPCARGRAPARRREPPAGVDSDDTVAPRLCQGTSRRRPSWRSAPPSPPPSVEPSAAERGRSALASCRRPRRRTPTPRWSRGRAGAP